MSAARPGRGAVSYDVATIRKDFPILARRIHGKPLAFLDSAASAQKPRAVIDAVSDLYSAHYANVHRGVYQLSLEATDMLEAVRDKVAAFLGARDRREIVFTSNATEAINLVAYSYGRRHVEPGDEVLVTHMEHHGNFVPWQVLCEERGAVLRVAPIDDRGVLRMDEFEKLLSPRTRIAAVTHVSNVLGTVNPVREIAQLCRKRGVPLLVDGAQAVPHQRVDVGALGCDFYAFSGHKLYGPSGVGVLWGRAALLEAMPPFLTGGSMIESVTLHGTTFAGIPQRFEAGTPNIAAIIGLGAAIDYVERIGFDAIGAHERALLGYADARLAEVPGLHILGTAPHKAAVISMVMDDVHPHDLGTILDREGVAVRTGHHCAQPLMERFDVPATARASLALYNDESDVDALVSALHVAREVFA
ncbi:MAG TPA: cysteine desulfurase [Myxococcota bacterium]|nr:cysteine desulfurase [Myxococcota bacterium]